MLLAIYSIFVFIFIGYAAKILRLVNINQSGILLGFLLNFALPAQIFNGAYHTPIHLDFILMCLVALVCNLCSGAFLFFIAKKLKLDNGTKLAFCIMGVLGNTLFLGIPFVSGALGDKYALQVVIFDQFVTSIPFAFLVPIALSLTSNSRFSLYGVFLRLAKSPLFLSLIVALTLRLLPFSLPEWLFAPIKSLAQTATPVALFAIGVQMSLKSILEWKLTALLLSGKMLLAPLLFFIFALLLRGGFGDDTTPINNTWRMALMEISMPPLVSSIAILLTAGFSSKLAVNAVTFGIIISFATIPMWLYLSRIL